MSPRDCYLLAGLIGAQGRERRRNTCSELRGCRTRNQAPMTGHQPAKSGAHDGPSAGASGVTIRPWLMSEAGRVRHGRRARQIAKGRRRVWPQHSSRHKAGLPRGPSPHSLVARPDWQVSTDPGLLLPGRVPTNGCVRTDPTFYDAAEARFGRAPHGGREGRERVRSRRA